MLLRNTLFQQTACGRDKRQLKKKKNRKENKKGHSESEAAPIFTPFLFWAHVHETRSRGLAATGGGTQKETTHRRKNVQQAKQSAQQPITHPEAAAIPYKACTPELNAVRTNAGHKRAHGPESTRADSSPNKNTGGWRPQEIRAR